MRDRRYYLTDHTISTGDPGLSFYGATKKNRLNSIPVFPSSSVSRSLVPTYKGYDRYTVWLLHPWLTVLAYLLSTATHPWIYLGSTQVQYLERTGSLVDGHAKVLSWFARCCWLLPLIYPSSFWCRRLICWYCASVVCSGCCCFCCCCCCLPLLWFAVDRNSYLWTALKVFNTAHCRNNNNNSNINTIRKGRRKKEI